MYILPLSLLPAFSFPYIILTKGERPCDTSLVVFFTCNMFVHFTLIIHELDPFFNENFKSSMCFLNNFSKNKLVLLSGKANR